MATAWVQVVEGTRYSWLNGGGMLAPGQAQPGQSLPSQRPRLRQEKLVMCPWSPAAGCFGGFTAG